MLFVVDYELTWEMLEAAMAKRLEWDDLKPEGFRFLGEYIWPDGDPAFRGVAIFEADTVEDLNGFVLHYGPTLKMRAHPASDVVSAISMAQPGRASASSPRKNRRRRAKRR
jgi:hypothetical protein